VAAVAASPRQAQRRTVDPPGRFQRQQIARRLDRLDQVDVRIEPDALVQPLEFVAEAVSEQGNAAALMADDAVLR
jgi:hypothetical protein